MTRTTLAVAADYADALLVARRSKNALFLLLLLVILLQLAVFVLYRYDVWKSQVDASHLPGGSNAVTPSTLPVDTTAAAPDATTTTAPAATPAAARPAASGREIAPIVYRWVLNATNFLGMTLVVVLGVVLLLTTAIMLVGRLIGVSHVTSAFVWCVFLAILLFPWQSLLNSRGGYYESAAYGEARVPDQKIPGVLYTWTELYDTGVTNERGGRFETQPVDAAVVLHWARFAGFPVLALLLLLMVQTKSSRGLRFALGESDIQVDVATGTATRTTHAGDPLA